MYLYEAMLCYLASFPFEYSRYNE